jgi:hypothetical protein
MTFPGFFCSRPTEFIGLPCSVKSVRISTVLISGRNCRKFCDLEKYFFHCLLVEGEGFEYDYLFVHFLLDIPPGRYNENRSDIWVSIEDLNLRQKVIY